VWNSDVSKPRFDLTITTDDPDLTAHAAMLALAEIFSNLRNTANINSRRYILALEDGEPVFRRDDICLAVENTVNEVLGLPPNKDGDDIVPQKLCKLFPGRRQPRDV
jgi:hypothetical protein